MPPENCRAKLVKPSSEVELCSNWLTNSSILAVLVSCGRWDYGCILRVTLLQSMVTYMMKISYLITNRYFPDQPSCTYPILYDHVLLCCKIFNFTIRISLIASVWTINELIRKEIKILSKEGMKRNSRSWLATNLSRGPGVSLTCG